jgi:NAD(P)-dependent dehydrogenase (short-subunit alcohol dehydrogenase family)
MSDSKKKVLLLGVTGGVGEDVGKALVAAGYEVYATCRGAQQRDALQAGKQYQRVLLLDLGSMASIDAAFAELASAGVTRLDGLINCAAMLHGTPLEFVTEEEMHRVFQTNVFGTLHAVQRAIPLLRPARGRIVLVGSLSGSFVMPLTGIYSASKFALEGLCDALRRELYPWGIKVALVKPGAIATRMFFGHLDNVRNERAALKGDQLLYEPLYRAHERQIPKTTALAVSTTKVAQLVMHGLTAKNPQARYFPGADSKLTGFFVRITPDSVLDWLARKVFFPLQ